MYAKQTQTIDFLSGVTPKPAMQALRIRLYASAPNRGRVLDYAFQGKVPDAWSVVPLSTEASQAKAKYEEELPIVFDTYINCLAPGNLARLRTIDPAEWARVQAENDVIGLHHLVKHAFYPKHHQMFTMLYQVLDQMIKLKEGSVPTASRLSTVAQLMLDCKELNVPDTAWPVIFTFYVVVQPNDAHAVIRRLWEREDLGTTRTSSVDHMIQFLSEEINMASQVPTSYPTTGAAFLSPTKGQNPTNPTRSKRTSKPNQPKFCPQCYLLKRPASIYVSHPLTACRSHADNPLPPSKLEEARRKFHQQVTVTLFTPTDPNPPLTDEHQYFAFLNIYALAASHNIPRDSFVMDTGTNRHSTNQREALVDIRRLPYPESFSTVVGTDSWNETGYHPDLRMHMYVKTDSIVSLLSFSLLIEDYDYSFDKTSRCHKFTSPNGLPTLTFTQHHPSKLYLLDRSCVPATTSLLTLRPAVQTPPNLKSPLYLAHCALNHASPQRMRIFLKNNTVGFIPSESEYDKLKSCPTCILVSRRPSRSFPDISYNEPKQLPFHTVAMDVLFAKPTLDPTTKRVCIGFLAVETTFNLLLFFPSPRHTTETALDAIAAIRTVARSFNKDVFTLKVDPESALKATVNPLARLGIEVLITPARNHRYDIERQIGVLRNSMSACLLQLPYTLPVACLPYLAAWCVATLNVLPNIKTGSASPLELVTYRNTPNRSLGTHLNFSFGSIVTVPKPERDSTPHIGLLIGRNFRRPIVQVLDLSSHRILTTDWRNLKSFPLTEEIKSLISGYANIAPIHPTHLEITTSGFAPTIPPPVPIPTATSQPPPTPPTEPAPNNTESPTSNTPSTPYHTPSSSINNTHTSNPPSPLPFILEEDNPTMVTNTTTSDAPAPTRTSTRIRSTHDYSILNSQGFQPLTSLFTTSYLDRPLQVAPLTLLSYAHPQRAEATKRELDAMFDQQVLEPTLPQHVPRDAKVLQSRILITEKYDADGKYERVKARLVAGGNRQILPPFTIVAAPTSDMSSFQILLTIAASNPSYELLSVDFDTAYLNAPTTHEAWLRLEPDAQEFLLELRPSLREFINPKTGKIIFRVRRALYGLKPSALDWYHHLSSWLTSHGFTQSQWDAGVFFRRDQSKLLLIIVYVDDLLITGPPDMVQSFLSDLSLTKMRFKTKRSTPLTYLSLRIERDSTNGIISVSQPGFTKQVIEEVFQLSPTDVERIPYTLSLFEIPPDAKLLNPDQAFLFRRGLMSCGYLKRSVVGLDLPFSFLATRMQHPTDSDMSKLIHMAKYINGSGIRTQFYHPCSDMQLRACSDASFSTHMDMSSHLGGFVSFSNGNPIVTFSHVLRDSIPLSSTEAELEALSRLVLAILPARGKLVELGFPQTLTPIEQDNKSAILLATMGPGRSKASRPWLRRVFFVSKYINHQISLTHVPTDLNEADPLTKPVPATRFIDWRNKRELPPS